ncbi:MAG: undecaprenyl-diphosphate phosphatase [Caulobacteraceae bacterium]
MNEWLAALILGLVEGATEFIPVSSTGHLLLTKELLGLTDPSWDTFIVMIQLGAILSVVVLYFQRLWRALVTLPTDPASRHFALSILIAFLPAVVLGVTLHDFIKQVLFESPALICWSLLIGGFVLLALERWKPEPKLHDATRYPLLTSLAIGLFQVLSMIPGVSRSGATIAGALLMGGDRKSAAEFSFFLAIPTMAGAFAYDFYKSRDQIHMDQGALIAVGFVVSFVAGLLAVKAMIGLVQKYGFAPFAWWRIAVGAIGLVVLALT